MKQIEKCPFVENKEKECDIPLCNKERMLENGVVVLPCKVGDDVVVLHAQYYDSDCKRMHYVMWHKEFKYSLLDEHKLGETLFFTEKEAIDFVHEHNGTVNKPTFQYLIRFNTI